MKEKFLSKVIQKSRLCPNASDSLILKLVQKEFSQSEIDDLAHFSQSFS